MTLVAKRSLLKLAGWTAVAATAALVGCGKKEEPPAAAAPAPPPHRRRRQSRHR